MERLAFPVTRAAWYRFKLSWSRMTEALVMKLAWALPRRLAYWAAIRVMAHATQGKYEHQIVPELLAVDALKRWDLN